MYDYFSIFELINDDDDNKGTLIVN